MMWMKLKPIIQSEVSQKDKHQYCILTMMVLTILHAGQQRRHRGKEESLGLRGRRQGWDDWREEH